MPSLCELGGGIDKGEGHVMSSIKQTFGPGRWEWDGHTLKEAFGNGRWEADDAALPIPVLAKAAGVI